MSLVRAPRKSDIFWSLGVLACWFAVQLWFYLRWRESWVGPMWIPAAVGIWILFDYLRLRRTDYDEAALAAWAKKVMALAGTWSEAFVYFKHEEAGIGPRLASQLVMTLGKPA